MFFMRPVHCELRIHEGSARLFAEGLAHFLDELERLGIDSGLVLDGPHEWKEPITLDMPEMTPVSRSGIASEAFRKRARRPGCPFVEYVAVIQPSLKITGFDHDGGVEPFFAHALHGIGIQIVYQAERVLTLGPEVDCAPSAFFARNQGTDLRSAALSQVRNSILESGRSSVTGK